MRVLTAVVSIVVAGMPLAGQQFQPPKSSSHGGTRLGLFGFGVRGGIDLRRSSQLVLGTTLDVGDLFSNRLRLRPSAEIGVFNGPNTYVGSMEVLWRFTDDADIATPYIGAGLGIAGRDACSADPHCPGLWLNVAFGFELHYRSTFNWLVEYHGMDQLRHQRLLIGLTTRRGN